MVPTRMRSVLVSTVLALGVSVAGMTFAAPAQAAMHNVDDPARDVTTFERDGSTTPKPANKVVDIVHARYDYRQKFLFVTVRARAVGSQVRPMVTIANGRRQIAFEGTPRGLVAPGFGEKPCPGGRSTRNAATGLYRMSIPVACFGAPRSVRVALSLERTDFANYASTSDHVGRQAQFSPAIRRS